MKRFTLALVALIVLVVLVGYNVWRANQEPVTTPPSLVEIGRQKLHTQLDDSKRTEVQIEQQDWNSPALLQQVIEAHQQRIDKLKGNSQAGEIVAHDREAIERLQKRITELREQAAARAAAESAAADGIAPSSATAGQSGADATRAPAAPSSTAPKASQPGQNAAPKSAGTAAQSPRSATGAHPSGQTSPKPPSPKPAAPKAAAPASSSPQR